MQLKAKRRLDRRGLVTGSVAVVAPVASVAFRLEVAVAALASTRLSSFARITDEVAVFGSSGLQIDSSF